ncbi:MAG: type 1 glutamine amidotransferase [Actinomycetales bacterium]
MRALAIVHDHTSPLGPVKQALRESGFDVVEHSVMVGPEPADMPRSLPDFSTRFPALEGVDVVVVMGSVCSAYDPRVEAWVQAECDLLRRADTAEIPVLGICFGGQLLALAHGGSVRRTAHPEIGFAEVDSDDEHLVPSGPWFEWHSDRWEMPTEATEIARNTSGPQAFVLRRNLAVQFHPEVTSDSLRGWLDNGGREVAIDFGLDPEAMLAESVTTDSRSITRAARLVQGFLSRTALGN